ncbi:helix-turn-helix domain-containing protein [Alkalimonas mucilaginosa]|uniref:Helix-turn-helix domain-containing protein n=1 Tax=Alkalimonas mucilaginosa TaxID=3057676 RepID=A0ABU7JGN5_9GAMM|nr:helix-turn-helix domain-containing protein [Alkalimonas sp. MEB004]MEE2024173.1 helix-turn-helix domain-containing protein [Alkalimonas sp. MEB004]
MWRWFATGAIDITRLLKTITKTGKLEMTYRFTGSPVLSYLGTTKEAKRTHIPNFLAEDELIKHLIAYEPMFTSLRGSLRWDLSSCSIVTADLAVFNAAIDDLLLSILNHCVSPIVVVTAQANENSLKVVFKVTSGVRAKAFSDTDFQQIRKLMRSLNADASLAESEAFLTIEITLSAKQRLVNGEHPAERQITQFNLHELARLNNDADNFNPLVLIVEPNDELRRFLVRLLQPDYRVLEAITGKQAFEIACNDIPDLIVTDVLLQELDGLSLLKELSAQESTSHIPVMFLSGIKASEAKIDALQLGAVDYLTKPFIAAELLLKIRNVVQTRYRVVLSNGGRLPLDRLKNALPERELEFLTRLERLVALLFADPELDTASLATHLAMSDRQLQRKVKALLHQTPVEYIREYRLHRAKEHLLKGKPVALVSDLVGFASPSHFSKCFKLAFQQTPSEFAQSL